MIRNCLVVLLTLSSLSFAGGKERGTTGVGSHGGHRKRMAFQKNGLTVVDILKRTAKDRFPEIDIEAYENAVKNTRISYQPVVKIEDTMGNLVPVEAANTGLDGEITVSDLWDPNDLLIPFHEYAGIVGSELDLFMLTVRFAKMIQPDSVHSFPKWMKKRNKRRALRRHIRGLTLENFTFNKTEFQLAKRAFMTAKMPRIETVDYTEWKQISSTSILRSSDLKSDFASFEVSTSFGHPTIRSRYAIAGFASKSATVDLDYRHGTLRIYGTIQTHGDRYNVKPDSLDRREMICRELDEKHLICQNTWHRSPLQKESELCKTEYEFRFIVGCPNYDDSIKSTYRVGSRRQRMRDKVERNYLKLIDGQPVAYTIYRWKKSVVPSEPGEIYEVTAPAQINPADAMVGDWRVDEANEKINIVRMIKISDSRIRMLSPCDEEIYKTQRKRCRYKKEAVLKLVDGSQFCLTDEKDECLTRFTPLVGGASYIEAKNDRFGPTLLKRIDLREP